MSKKSIHLAVVAAVTALKLEATLNTKLNAIFDEHLAPKTGGGTVNLDEVTKKDADGKFISIQCAVSGVWLPANLAFFYEDKSDNPKITDKDGKGLKRASRQAESIGKKFTKAQKASIQAITDDILELDATPENAPKIKTLKATLAAEKAKKVDYSSVSAKVAEPTQA